MELRLAICEDNQEHYERTCAYLNKALNGTSSFSHTRFSSAGEFLTQLEENHCPYDIILMDIDLGENSISGIDLAGKINAVNPNAQIIFISQYLAYATDVYETDHVYFITKEQLGEYLPRAIGAALKNLRESRNQSFYFSSGSREYQLPKSDVIYLERNLRQTHIYTKDAAYTTREKLQDLVDRLGPEFCVCHKSFAVNLNLVRTYGHDGILLLDGQHIPVSRSHYQSTKDALAFMKLSRHKEVD